MIAGTEDAVIIGPVSASAYTVPTDFPESDGTLEWNSTTLILVEVEAGGKKGIGYSYADEVVAAFINQKLKHFVSGQDAMNIPLIWRNMVISIRNEGNCGMAYMAVSAIDNALWDLKAKILNLPLCKLLGAVRNEVSLYGSGGFTSYPIEKLQNQLSGWVENGFTAVKMKIGRNPDEDIKRVKAARQSIGQEAALMVDANGAYDAKTAIKQAEVFAEFGVTWFEEPVSSDNLSGLKFVREHFPASINLAAGEYGYSIGYFAEMIKHKAVDVLQADATRCGGLTGFLKAGYLAEADHLAFSFHCAPALHLHAAMALNSFYTGEYFYDHTRIENMLFDGTQLPVNGKLKPDLSRLGTGLEFKHLDAEKFRVG